MGNRRSIPPKPLGRVRRSIPPPREELPTLVACLHCGGKEGEERFKFESDPAMKAVRDDPIAGLQCEPDEKEGPGTYSVIKGCRFCTVGTMTRVQVQRYRRWAEQRESRRLKLPKP